MLGAHGQRASLDAMRGAPQRCAVGAFERNLQCSNVGAHARLQLGQDFGNALRTAGELLDARTIDRIAARRAGGPGARRAPERRVAAQPLGELCA